MPKGFNFGVAHGLLLDGKRVARLGWNGKDMYLYLLENAKVFKQNPGELSSVMVVERMAILVTPNGQHVPWLCSTADMWTDDWYEVQDES